MSLPKYRDGVGEFAESLPAIPLVFSSSPSDQRLADFCLKFIKENLIQVSFRKTGEFGQPVEIHGPAYRPESPRVAAAVAGAAKESKRDQPLWMYSDTPFSNLSTPWRAFTNVRAAVAVFTAHAAPRNAGSGINNSSSGGGAGGSEGGRHRIVAESKEALRAVQTTVSTALRNGPTDQQGPLRFYLRGLECMLMIKSIWAKKSTWVEEADPPCFMFLVSAHTSQQPQSPFTLAKSPAPRRSSAGYAVAATSGIICLSPGHVLHTAARSFVENRSTAPHGFDSVMRFNPPSPSPAIGALCSMFVQWMKSTREVDAFMLDGLLMSMVLATVSRDSKRLLGLFDQVIFEKAFIDQAPLMQQCRLARSIITGVDLSSITSLVGEQIFSAFRAGSVAGVFLDQLMSQASKADSLATAAAAAAATAATAPAATAAAAAAASAAAAAAATAAAADGNPAIIATTLYTRNRICWFPTYANTRMEARILDNSMTVAHAVDHLKGRGHFVMADALRDYHDSFPKCGFSGNKLAVVIIRNADAASVLYSLCRVLCFGMAPKTRGDLLASAAENRATFGVCTPADNQKASPTGLMNSPLCAILGLPFFVADYTSNNAGPKSPITMLAMHVDDLFAYKVLSTLAFMRPGTAVGPVRVSPAAEYYRDSDAAAVAPFALSPYLLRLAISRQKLALRAFLMHVNRYSRGGGNPAVPMPVPDADITATIKYIDRVARDFIGPYIRFDPDEPERAVPVNRVATIAASGAGDDAQKKQQLNLALVGVLGRCIGMPSTDATIVKALTLDAGFGLSEFADRGRALQSVRRSATTLVPGGVSSGSPVPLTAAATETNNSPFEFSILAAQFSCKQPMPAVIDGVTDNTGMTATQPYPAAAVAAGETKAPAGDAIAGPFRSALAPGDQPHARYRPVEVSGGDGAGAGAGAGAGSSSAEYARFSPASIDSMPLNLDYTLSHIIMQLEALLLGYPQPIAAAVSAAVKAARTENDCMDCVEYPVARLVGEASRLVFMSKEMPLFIRPLVSETLTTPRFDFVYLIASLALERGASIPSNPLADYNKRWAPTHKEFAEMMETKRPTAADRGAAAAAAALAPFAPQLGAPEPIVFHPMPAAPMDTSEDGSTSPAYGGPADSPAGDSDVEEEDDDDSSGAMPFEMLGKVGVKRNGHWYELASDEMLRNLPRMDRDFFSHKGKVFVKVDTSAPAVPHDMETAYDEAVREAEALEAEQAESKRKTAAARPPIVPRASTASSTARPADPRGKAAAPTRTTSSRTSGAGAGAGAGSGSGDSRRPAAWNDFGTPREVVATPAPKAAATTVAADRNNLGFGVGGLVATTAATKWKQDIVAKARAQAAEQLAAAEKARTRARDETSRGDALEAQNKLLERQREESQRAAAAAAAERAHQESKLERARKELGRLRTEREELLRRFDRASRDARASREHQERKAREATDLLERATKARRDQEERAERARVARERGSGRSSASSSSRYAETATHKKQQQQQQQKKPSTRSSDKSSSKRKRDEDEDDVGAAARSPKRQQLTPRSADAAAAAAGDTDAEPESDVAPEAELEAADDEDAVVQLEAAAAVAAEDARSAGQRAAEAEAESESAGTAVTQNANELSVFDIIMAEDE